jgi:thioredoxin-related protein
MKKIILLLTTVFALLAANELKTVYSYKNAIYKAKKEDKLVLLMMTYKGCPVCDYMKDIVF